MKFGERLKDLRKKKGFSQSKFAELVKIHHSQIGRYEREECSPSSDILKKMATVLEVSTDFLVEGDTEEIASSQIYDRDLIRLFKRVQDLKTQDKEVVKILIEAFINRKQIEEMVRG